MGKDVQRPQWESDVAEGLPQCRRSQSRQQEGGGGVAVNGSSMRCMESGRLGGASGHMSTLRGPSPEGICTCSEDGKKTERQETTREDGKKTGRQGMTMDDKGWVGVKLRIEIDTFFEKNGQTLIHTPQPIHRRRCTKHHELRPATTAELRVLEVRTWWTTAGSLTQNGSIPGDD